MITDNTAYSKRVKLDKVISIDLTVKDLCVLFACVGVTAPADRFKVYSEKFGLSPNEIDDSYDYNLNLYHSIEDIINKNKV